MRKLFKAAMKKASAMHREQKGITGLETAIVLIAFVVVSSVFAFAALSTGLFSSDQAKETIQAGLKEAQGTIEVKGSVIANATLADVAAEAVGTGDGADTTWPLANGPVVPGSTVVSVDAVVQTEGTDYSISYDANPAVITFVVAPPLNDAITADYTHYDVDSVVLQVANSAGGRAVELTPGKTVLVYQDVNSLDTDIDNFGLSWLGTSDGDNLLETNETASLTVDVSGYALVRDQEFTIQIKPQSGATVNVSRTMSTSVTALMDLN